MTTQRDISHALKLYTAPTVEPLTATEARQHCRVDDPSEDTYIETLIVSARQYCENVTNRGFINQTWKLYLDSFPTQIELRICPVSSVTGITYVDTAGATTTLATSVYQLLAGEPGIIDLKHEQVWPNLRGDKQGIVVTFVAGYGAAGSSVPDTIKHAMKLLIAHWYRNREATAVEVPMDVAQTVKSLLTSEDWGAYS
jgi:uncharacterized phiE125 gp8 family phage protein